MDEALTLAQLVERQSRIPGVAERELLRFVAIDEGGGYSVRSMSHRSLWDRARRIASALARAGIGEGDRFAIMMENHPEFVEAMVASAIVGSVFVPIDPRARGIKLRYLLAASECRGVVTADYCVASLADAVAGTRVEWVWSVDGCAAAPAPAGFVPFETVVGEADPEAAPPIRGDHLDKTMRMMFTSGTTGDPKAIVGSYRRFWHRGHGLPALFGIRPDDVMYTGLSLTHGNAQNQSLAVALYSGIPLVVSRRFTKSRLWQVIADFGCTTMTALGGMYAAIYAEPPGPLDGKTPLRLITGSGMHRDLWQPFRERFKVDILEFYATAEGGMVVNPPGVGPVGSVGRPVEGFVARIVRDDDSECAPMEHGEIVFRHGDGRPVRVEYHGNPEASSAKTRGGWLRTGDIGYRDRDGWLYFVCRKGQEIRRNGEFISASFIEKELAEHPNVADVYVYGIAAANAAAGEKDIVAAVVLRNRDDWRPDEMFGYLAQRVERNAVPGFIQLLDEIPKTASEKPVERRLSELLRTSPGSVHPRP